MLMLIGELAREVGTTPRAIRYYEQQGLLHACRTANGYRHYPTEAVRRLHNIRRLLSLGFTTEEMRPFLPCLDADLDTEGICPASAETVAHKLALIDEEIRALTRMRERLAAVLHSSTLRAG